MKHKCQVFIVFCALFLNGCGLTSLYKKAPAEPIDLSTQRLATLDSHFALMNQITAADYQQQQSLFDQVFEDNSRQQSARARLRYALVLLTSGHPNTDPGRGYTELKEVLADPIELTPHEISLAKVVLNEAENIMILEARNTELSSAVSVSQFEKDKNGSNSRERFQRVRKELELAQEQILALEQELNDARKKLDEIKRIEVLSE